MTAIMTAHYFFRILDGNNITKLSHETFKELSSIETM